MKNLQSNGGGHWGCMEPAACSETPRHLPRPRHPGLSSRPSSQGWRDGAEAGGAHRPGWGAWLSLGCSGTDSPAGADLRHLLDSGSNRRGLRTTSKAGAAGRNHLQPPAPSRTAVSEQRRGVCPARRPPGVGLWRAGGRSSKLKTPTELRGLRRPGSRALAQKPEGQGRPRYRPSLSAPPTSIPAGAEPTPQLHLLSRGKGPLAPEEGVPGPVLQHPQTQGQTRVPTRESRTRAAP